MRKKIVLVWLKRDFRIHDHEPFARAIDTGLPIYAFYLHESSLIQCLDHSDRHLGFIHESILAMNRELRPFHVDIKVHQIEILQFLKSMMAVYDIAGIYSHQETGNDASYRRDKDVLAFLKSYGIPWYEYKPSYIIRGLRSGRIGWKEKWKSWMESPMVNPNWEKARDLKLFIGDSEGSPVTYRESSANVDSILERNSQHLGIFQKAGSIEAQETFRSFLDSRYRKYSGCISSPEESRTHCSRLSPYLAWGNISAKEIYQRTMSRREEINIYGRRQLDRFLSRLAWRDHMIQKFESESRIEFEHFNPGYDALKHEMRQDWIQAWEEGRTGFPLVDASMRCLIATGYLNFRMRAMLVSFFTMILWQDWRWGVHHLARLFLDYEPGIHYFQFQMQASTVGNHQIRIYNPYKQILDNDPDCIFIKRWIPELASAPAPDILSWGKESPGLFSPRTDYPMPILDFKKAYNRARDIMFSLQKSPEVKRNLAKIREVHVVDRREQSFR